MTKAPFWQTKSLSEMNPTEWESLCDGCGLCCLVRFETDDDEVVIPTRVHCKLFDSEKCQCSNYGNRKMFVPDCIKLTIENIPNLHWMPLSCAYRRLSEGKTLPKWHHLVSGDRNSVHEAGVSIKGQTVSERSLETPEEALDYLAYDLLEDRSDWEAFDDTDQP